MRIVYLIYKTGKNAGNTVVAGHVKELKKRKQDVHIVSLFGSASGVLSIFHIYKLFPIDVLVSTFWPTAYVAAVLPARKKVYFLQAWEEDFYTNPLLKKLVSASKTTQFTYMVNSTYLRDKVEALLPVRPEVIQNIGIDTKIFMPKKIKKNARPVILSVLSWYNRAKGPDLLVTAVKKLRKKHPNYFFMLVSLEKSPYEDIFDSFISQPTQQQLAILYQTADILLSTSRSEGFFIPGIEAMACGLPVVSTDSGGIKTYLNPNKNGVLIKNISLLWRDDTIEKLFKNYRLKNKIIREGLKTAPTYRWSTIGIQLTQIYGRK